MLYLRLISVTLAVLLLSGCLYPQNERRGNQAPNEAQLQSVQTAVEQFQENRSVLPIKTRDADTPIFRKYPIEFAQLVPAFLESAPGNSFENGGTYQYVLTNPEEEPLVKLIDLRITQTIQDLERRLYSYRSDHEYAPIEEVVGYELLKLDYEALNYDEEPTVESPFHPTHLLPLYMKTDGSIVIDYSLDIQFYLEEQGWGEFAEGDDLRWLLVEHAPFVPAYSEPQTVEDGEVLFIEN